MEMQSNRWYSIGERDNPPELEFHDWIVEMEGEEGEEIVGCMDWASVPDAEEVADRLEGSIDYDKVETCGDKEGLWDRCKAFTVALFLRARSTSV